MALYTLSQRSLLSLLAFLVVFSLAIVEGSGMEKDELNNRDILEDDSLKEIENEFDYFYNMEMMKRLSANDTKVYDDTEVYDDYEVYGDTELFDVYEESEFYDEYDVGTDYYEDSDELDFILDDLLDEEGLIENELDNIDIELIEPESDVYKSDIRQPRYRLNINLILLICLLLASASILLISLAWTACHCCFYNLHVDTGISCFPNTFISTF
jgi:hypothetical protein